MKTIILCALLLSGCGASYFSASTKGTVSLKDGTTASYESTKDQQGFHLEYDPVTQKFLLNVDKSSTSDAAIAASAQAMAAMARMLEKLAPLLEKAAAGGK